MLSRLFGSDGKPPVFLEFRSSKFFIVFTVAAAVFTDIFLYGIIVPVLPFALTTRASIPTEKVQTWVSILLAVYGGALLVASPICGWYADRSPSRKLSLLAGLVMLAGSTVLLTVGSSLGVFIAGRILQGFSAAVVWVVGLALLSDTVGSDELGMHMGYVAVAMSMAILLAPLLGGIVYDKGGYYDVFAMAFGLLGIDIVLRLALVEKKVAARWLEPKETSDPSTTTTTEMEEGGDAPEKQQQGQPNDPKTTTATAGTWPCSSSTTTNAQRRSSDTTTTLAVQNPTTRPSRLPPIITLLSSHRLLAALFGCLVQAALLTSFDSILPLHVRSLFSWSSIGAGLIFLPLTIPSFASPFIGKLADRYGPRYLGASGFVLAVPPLICLRLVTHDSPAQKVLLCALLAVVGFTLDMILVPLMAEIACAVEARAETLPRGCFGNGGAYAQAYGLFNMSFAAGSMAGPLLAGLISAHAGWGDTTLVLGCVSAVCVVPTLLWGGGYLFGEVKAIEAKDHRDDAVVL